MGFHGSFAFGRCVVVPTLLLSAHPGRLPVTQLIRGVVAAQRDVQQLRGVLSFVMLGTFGLDGYISHLRSYCRCVRTREWNMLRLLIVETLFF